MTSRRLHPSERARVALLVSVVFTLVLYVVPFGSAIAYPLMLVSTLAHEMGHGVTAILVGGSFERFLMWPDGSGAAYWAGPPNRLALALVAMGGLLGPAVAAAVGFAVGRTEKGARGGLATTAALLGLALLLVVRNAFGALFVLIVAVACGLVAAKASGEIAQLALVFLAVQLSLSVFSRGDYLFTPVAETAQGAMPSDVGQIAGALWLPYWFWGFLCAAASLAVLGWGLKRYWR